MTEIDRNKSHENPFFSFAKPYFDFIGKGKIYSIFYVVMAFLNLLYPVAVIFFVLNSGFLRYYGARAVIAFMLSWLVIAFSGWVGFQLWWNRKSNLRRYENSDFIATPVISEILQTFGECLGSFFIINGVGVGLISTVLLWDIAKIPLYRGPFRMFRYANLSFGPIAIVGGLIAGFIAIILFRFIAEQIKILASIANNSKDIARSLRK